MFTRVKGFRDIYGISYHYFNGLMSILDEHARRGGFTHIELPMLEKAGLFSKSAGNESDIVSKEMYVFSNTASNKKTEPIALRPEGTAPAVRAYIENKMYTQQYRIDKIAYAGAMFRRERPQRGRYRQFYQYGVEVFATKEPHADAELITMAYDAITEYGLKGVEVCLNSIGCKDCRREYEDALRNHFANHKDSLCQDCQERYHSRPMRLLDCKKDAQNTHTINAPKITDYLCNECGEHFDGVKNWLNTMGTPFTVDTRIVRGLDYYMRTAFELVHTPEHNNDAPSSVICGGGRYNGLVKSLGGPDVEGVGFAMGMDRIMEALMEQDKNHDDQNDQTNEDHSQTLLTADAYIATPLNTNNQTLGQSIATSITKGLRRAGLCVIMNPTCSSLKSQLKAANRYNARFTIIIGDNEIAEEALLVRDMASGEQVHIPLNLDEHNHTNTNTHTDSELCEGIVDLIFGGDVEGMADVIPDYTDYDNDDDYDYDNDDDYDDDDTNINK